MNPSEKIRENRIRRTIARRGYALNKSRRRDPKAWDFGSYQITDPQGGGLVFANWAVGHGFGLSLDDVEEWLERDE